jgi:two-component SAPR family response regulator
MTGLQLKEKVVALRSNMKFLLISGYLEEVMGSSDQNANIGDFLEKPFLPDELARKVGEILTRTNEMHEGPKPSPEPPFHKAATGTTHG